jgi:hypothetical protein
MESKIRDNEPRKKAHILPAGTACCFSEDCGMDGVLAGRLAESQDDGWITHIWIGNEKRISRYRIEEASLTTVAGYAERS